MNDQPVSDGNTNEDNSVAVAIMFNTTNEVLSFNLPAMTQEGFWKLVFNSTETPPSQTGPASWNLLSRSIVCAIFSRRDFTE
jgi:hypothetical protein